MSWRAYIRLFKGSRWTLAASFAFAIVQAALLLPVAVVVRRVFDTLIPQGRVGALFVAGAAILGLYLISAGFGLLTRYTVLRAVKDAIAELRAELIRHVYDLPTAYFDRTRLGVVHSTIVQDSERVDCMSASLVGQLMPAVVVSVGLGAMLVYLNAVLFAWLLCVVPILIGVGKLLGRAVQQRGRVWQGAFDVFSAQTLLALRAMTLTKVHGAEELEIATRREQVRDLSGAGRDVAWLASAYSIVQGTVATSAGVVVLVLGGRAVARHEMTLGDLLSFYAVVALLLRQVNSILGTIPVVLTGAESIKRLDGLFAQAQPQPYTGRRRHAFRGGLDLEAVSFGYRDELVLHDVTLSLAPGERIAIVGPNGAGKSTVASLILGLYRPRTGRCYADGVAYDDLDVQTLRRQMGVVLQDPLLLPGSVRDNIAYGLPHATDAEIEEAARRATAHSFVETLRDGYATDVGDDGGLVSGGQRQRIAIARALIGKPALLILDEPTTHLDDAAIAELMSNLAELPRRPSVLVITHDPEVAAQADRIHQLRDGRAAAALLA